MDRKLYRIKTESLRTYIKDRGVVYLPVNCLIEADDEQTTHVKNFVSSHVLDNNLEGSYQSPQYMTIVLRN